MQIAKLIGSVVALTLSSHALAQTHFECGAVACSAFGSGVITAIDDVVVDGKAFNVTFTSTPTSTFLFSSHTAAPGQPLTGVDAANALDAFYSTQQGPVPQDDGPGIFARVAGVAGPEEIFNFVTAYQATSKPGIVEVDITEPFLGGGYQNGPTLVAPNVGDAGPVAGGGPVVTELEAKNPCSFGTCLVWTPIKAAPEISPAPTTAALTLLLGSLVVLRGRRAR
jgi:hypothetical protein